jgi:hypothetical protein
LLLSSPSTAAEALLSRLFAGPSKPRRIPVAGPARVAGWALSGPAPPATLSPGVVMPAPALHITLRPAPAVNGTVAAAAAAAAAAARGWETARLAAGLRGRFVLPLPGGGGGVGLDGYLDLGLPLLPAAAAGAAAGAGQGKGRLTGTMGGPVKGFLGLPTAGLAFGVVHQVRERQSYISERAFGVVQQVRAHRHRHMDTRVDT